jgi:sRNA-binding carbon storage regulator CsrA
MLIVSRPKDGEVVVRAPDGTILRVVVTKLVVGRDGGRGYVELGFDMPKEYEVLRK